MTDPLTELRAMLPPGAQAGGGRIAGLQGALLPGETAAVARARPVRVAEFTAGRIAARQVLGAVALPRGPLGPPLWPMGIAGSISHAGGWALAVVSDRAHGIGVDLELAGADLPLPEIAHPQEAARLAGRDPVLLFSAKEAAYKAQFALTGRMLGFHDLEVTLQSDGFEARFLCDAPPFAAGAVIAGRQGVAGGLVVSLAVIGDDHHRIGNAAFAAGWAR